MIPTANISRSILNSLLWVFLGSFFCSTASFAEAPSSSIRQQVAPYLLPIDHPIHPTLDAIFSKTRATFSVKSMQEAGFARAKPRPFTLLLVTRHPLVPDYIFKLYLDAQRFYKNEPEYYCWLKRVKGANLLRSLIAQHGWENEFNVPHKWLYELPTNHLPSVGYELKYYILVEDDMHVLSHKENRKLWASDYVSHELLNKLYILIKEAGLADSLKPENIPFSRDGRIAFVDTESYGETNISYKKLQSFLSKENKNYWNSLIYTK